MGETYAALLAAALSKCQHCHLIVPAFAKAQKALLEPSACLRVLPTEVREVNEWPGTTLYGGATATMWRYRCGPDLVDALLGVTDALYSWRAPKLPEDLGFTRDDGSVWLASITHERDGYLSLTEEEHASLIAEFPILALVVAPEPDPNPPRDQVA